MLPKEKVFDIPKFFEDIYFYFEHGEQPIQKWRDAKEPIIFIGWKQIKKPITYLQSAYLTDLIYHRLFWGDPCVVEDFDYESAKDVVGERLASILNVGGKEL